MYGSLVYVRLDRVRKDKRNCSFFVRYVKIQHKAHTLRLTPYSLNKCCIFTYRTQMSTVCISTIIISKTAEAGIIRDQKLISVLKNHRSWPIKKPIHK